MKLRELITLALKGPRVPHLWISMGHANASKHTSNSTSQDRLCQYGHWHTLINNTILRSDFNQRADHIMRCEGDPPKQANQCILSHIFLGHIVTMQLFSYAGASPLPQTSSLLLLLLLLLLYVALLKNLLVHLGIFKLSTSPMHC